MLEYYVFAGGRSGLGQFGSATTRLYPYDTTSLIIGQYSNVAGTTATDYIVANSAQGVHIHRNTTFKNLQNGGTMTVSVLGNLVTSANVSIGEELSVTGQVNATGNVATSSHFIGNNMQLSGQAEIIGNVFSEYYFGNIAFASGGAESSIPDNIFTNVTGNLTGEYANVIWGNIGNTRFMGGNVAVSGQINVLGNIVAPFFVGEHRGNVIGDYANVITGNIGNTRFVGGNVAVSGQINVLGNVVAPFFIGEHRGNVIGDYANVITGNIGNTRFVGGNVAVSGQINVLGNVVAPFFIGEHRGNVIGDYANVITGNIGNTRFVGGNIAVSGQINTLGNVVAPFFLGNVIGNFGNIGNVRMEAGNVAVSGQINVLGNVVAPFHLGNVIGNFGNIGNVRMEAGNVLANSANIANVQLDASNVIAQYYRGNGALLTGLVESSRFLSVSRATDQPRSGGTWANAAIILDRVLANSGITYNSTTGVVTLEGGITYRVTAQMGWDSAGGYIFGFRMVESVSQTQVGPGAAETFAMSVSGVNNPTAPVLDFLITPTVTTTYQLRTTGATNAGAAEAVRFDVGTFMNIVSVSSKPIVSQGGWTKVTDWNFGGSTTAPTLASSATRHYAWAVTGKMLSIKGFYNQTATTGAAAGSGEYLLAMPGGYRIDTTTTGLATVGDILEIPIGQLTLSTGTGNRGAGVVSAYDSGNIKFSAWSAGGLSANITTIGSAFFPLTSSALYSLYFSADIPIV